MGAGLLEGVLGFFLELTLDSLVRHWAGCFPCSVTGLGSGRVTKGAEAGLRSRAPGLQRGCQQKHFYRGQSYRFRNALSITLIPLTPLPVQGSDPRPQGPVLVLRFSYICPDRQLRRYMVLEPDAQAAVQVTEPSVGPRQLGEAGNLRTQVLLTAVSGPPCFRSCWLC